MMNFIEKLNEVKYNSERKTLELFETVGVKNKQCQKNGKKASIQKIFTTP